MNYLDNLIKWIAQITQIVVVLVPLAIAAEVLFGNKTTFFSGVVSNLVELIQSFGNQGLVGLIALTIVVWLFSAIYKRS